MERIVDGKGVRYLCCGNADPTSVLLGSMRSCATENFAIALPASNARTNAKCNLLNRMGIDSSWSLSSLRFSIRRSGLLNGGDSIANQYLTGRVRQHLCSFHFFSAFSSRGGPRSRVAYIRCERSDLSLCRKSQSWRTFCRLGLTKCQLTLNLDQNHSGANRCKYAGKNCSCRSNGDVRSFECVLSINRRAVRDSRLPST